MLVLVQTVKIRIANLKGLMKWRWTYRPLQVIKCVMSTVVCVVSKLYPGQSGLSLLPCIVDQM